MKPLQPRRSSSAEERPSKGATLQTVGIQAAAYGGKKILAALSGRILGAKCADWENAKKNIKVNPLHNAQEINYSRGFCDLNWVPQSTAYQHGHSDRLERYKSLIGK